MIHALNDLSALDLGDLLSMADGEQTPVETVENNGQATPVAIVGMAGRIAGCDDLDAFWELLRDGRSARRSLPDCRRGDLETYLRLKDAHRGDRPVTYFDESFLSDIDKFDHRYFGLARHEANLTDPNQRLFLETAWTALEHAGYATPGGATGVYLGFSADFGDAYRDIVRTLAPDAPEVAVVGNIRSILASRIAYQLDLHGPSMLVDTACSSGLVALHLACRALQAGDCEMAIAGAVKIDLVPVADEPSTGVGIKDIHGTGSSDGVTRTFDDRAEGTAGAEGALAFVLKPLQRALADGDTVHAVILGSAVNQDGQSVGITAPNMAAQEALIARALRNAGVSADGISCMEAHGTGTSLGDPIEVGAIRRAFERHTARRQFCAIGSVKTNVGHLDNAAGLAGLAKMVLSMRHAQIPASLNFSFPNRKIAFDRAPVYVNDVLRPWQPPEGVPMRAGISSFGLSGTNCHVVIEQAPPVPVQTEDADGPFLLPLSACTPESLRALVARYRDFLRGFHGRAADLCFTAAVGRTHREQRMALCFDALPTLRAQIDALATQGLEAAIEGVVHVPSSARAGADGGAQDIAHEAERWSQRWHRAGADARSGLIEDAAALYARGADLDWFTIYGERAVRRIPLPTYPFARTRCWVQANASGERLAARGAAKAIAHPLLDRCVVDSMEVTIYDVSLGADSHWELADHEVHGRYVLPGVCFIEMLLESAVQTTGGAGFCPVQVKGLSFLRPLSLDAGERRTVQLVLDGPADARRVRVLSRATARGRDGEWDVHAEGTLAPASGASPETLDLARLRAELGETMRYDAGDDAERGLRIGERWTRSVLEGRLDPARERFLITLALPERFADDAGRYHFHPALIDNAVNAANHLIDEDGLYLPFSYGRFEAFAPLPERFHVHLRLQPGSSREAYRFDLECVDDRGRVVALARDYIVRRVSLEALQPAVRNDLHAIRMVPVAADAAPASATSAGPMPAGQMPGSEILVVGGPVRDGGAAASLSAAGLRATEIGIDREGAVLADTAAFEDRRFAAIVYAAAVEDHGDEQLRLLAFARLLAWLERMRVRADGPLLVLAPQAFATDGVSVDPGMAALAALARIAALENPQWRIRCVDTDAPIDAAWLRGECAVADRDLSVYRDGQRLQECLEPVPSPSGVASPYRPQAEGVYLITGGLGALGLAAAAHLAAKGPIRLALLSSTPLPPRTEWDAPQPPRSRAAIDGVRALEAASAQVECFAVDVADATALSGVLQGLRARHGRINGVIHAAGRAGEGFLRSKSDEVFARVVAPKIAGAHALDALTAADPLEFFVLYSSVATVLRSAGQADYTAGNAYLDALAQRRRAAGRTAHALCWPAWREIGIAVEYGALDEDEFFVPIAPAHALELLDRVLAAGDALPPVLLPGHVHPQGEAATLERLGIVASESLGLRRVASRRGAAQQAAVVDVVVHGIDEDESVTAVAALWSRVLGMTEFDADDKFTDHGGNSILTTQLYREYEALQPGAMDMVSLFSAITIRDQAALLRKSRKPAPAPLAAPAAPAAPAPAPASAASADDDQALEDVLARLAEGALSAEEAEALLMR